MDLLPLMPGRRTYLYKLTSDRGGAPCAPPPLGGAQPLLSLSICKPAIRRTAQAGDQVLGISSQSLVLREGYAPIAVIYAAVITGAVDAREYYAPASPFGSRPDCIYAFHQEQGRLEHAGRSPLHAEPGYRARDVGQYPFYKNGRTLLSENFRYFGSEARSLTAAFPLLQASADALGQGHRVFDEGCPEQSEIERLFRSLWKRATRFTPAVVTQEAYGHAPRATKTGSQGMGSGRVFG